MKYHHIKQHEITDCGAACLATISKQYGLKIPITKIREVAGTDKQGTNALGMIKAAEQLGFTAKALNSERTASLESEKKFVKLLRSVFKNGCLNNASSTLSQSVSVIGGVVIL